MKKEFWKRASMFFLIPMLAFGMILPGCSDDGDNGAPGKPGAPGSSLVDVGTSSPETLAALTASAEITDANIASPPVVKFKVVDNFGRGITGLDALRTQGDLSFTRFTIAKLVPGANGNPDSWVSYVRDPATGNRFGAPTTERNGTLVDHGDGNYTYTFSTNVSNVTTPVAVSYQPALTHRVAIQISGAGLNNLNPTKDFVPAGGAVTNTRDIAMTSSCNECHGELRIHGSRVEVDYCVTCHNPDLTNGEGNMSYMVHFIHNASGAFTALDDAWDVSAFVMPTGFDVRNCQKCHSGNDAATPDANNWQFLPNKAACEGCHTDAHSVAMTDNSGCVGCHSEGGLAGTVEMSHRTNFSTENNPEVPAWAKIVKYEIASVTVDGANNPVVKFRVLTKQNSTDAFLPLDLAQPLPVGMAFGPAFRIAWSLPQAASLNPIDGPAIAAPADWNNHFSNLGTSPRQYFNDAVATGTFAFDQPTTVSMSAALALPINAGAAMDADGYFTWTLNTTPFPADATRMGVAIESGFTFNDGTANVRLPGEAVIAEVGTTPRRQIVSSAKCSGCHERLALHGGSRHVNPNQCVICHNAEITNSGRDATHGEFSNNLKDMVHAIHAGAIRSTPFDFIRASSAGGGGGAGLHEFSHVSFFDREAECTVCHLDGTYMPEEVPVSASWSTFIAAPTAAAGDWVPGANMRYSPVYAACFSCHDSAAAQSHFDANMTTDRDGNVTETCVTCHAAGRSADVKVVHGL